MSFCQSCSRPNLTKSARLVRLYSSAPPPSGIPPRPTPRQWNSTQRPSQSRATLQNLRSQLAPNSKFKSSAPRTSTRTPAPTPSERFSAEELSPTAHSRTPVPTQALAHRNAMKTAFPDGWAPPKKLSREAMDGLRTLHAHDPVMFSTPILADRFKISPEAVRRILKSKWVPDDRRKAKMMQIEREASQQLLEKREEDKRQKKGRLRSLYMDEESDMLFMEEGGVAGENSRAHDGPAAVDEVDERHEFDDPKLRKKRERKSIPIHYR